MGRVTVVVSQGQTTHKTVFPTDDGPKRREGLQVTQFSLLDPDPYWYTHDHPPPWYRQGLRLSSVLDTFPLVGPHRDLSLRTGGGVDEPTRGRLASREDPVGTCTQKNSVPHPPTQTNRTQPSPGE